MNATASSRRERRALAWGCAALLLAVLGSRLVNARDLPERTATQVVAAGERFYLQGLSPQGAAIPAVVQGDLTVDSSVMPCVNCHRRSAWGSTEGSVTVPSIAGAALFAPVTRGSVEMGSLRKTGAGTRPAYTEASLLRALRDGVDPAGRVMSPTMPRYAIGEADVVALSAYLQSLSADTPAGVTNTTIHLATIVMPAVDEGRRASMLDVLRAYVRQKNAGTRNETARRERGAWDMRAHDSKYRQWLLHEWVLAGPSSTWASQLEEAYRRQPVYALVAGLGDGDWAPVHDFSERVGVPVVLPMLVMPPVRPPADSFYSLYFSRGLAVETETLAHHLSAGSAVRVLQVSRCGSPEQDAAAVFARGARRPVEVRSECLPASSPLTSASLEPLLQSSVDALVLWLGRDDLRDVSTGPSAAAWLDKASAVYLSSSLLGVQARQLPAALAEKALLLQSSVPPDEFDQHAWRGLAWMKANGLRPDDPEVAVNALFAASLTADALSHAPSLVSREFFVERIEHMTEVSPHRSAYPSVKFGSERRTASLGCSILKVPSAPGNPYRKVLPWFVPAS